MLAREAHERHRALLTALKMERPTEVIAGRYRGFRKWDGMFERALERCLGSESEVVADA